MKILFKQKTFIVIRSRDLDKFIEQIYGIPFDCTGSRECEDGAYYRFNIKKENLSKWQSNTLKNFLDNQNMSWSTLNVLMQDMCNKDIIDEGEYLMLAEIG